MANNNVRDSVITGASIAATGALIEVGVTTASYLMNPDYREAFKELYFDSVNERLEKGPLVWK